MLKGPYINMDPINGNTSEYQDSLINGELHKLFYRWSIMYGTIYKFYELVNDNLIPHVVVLDPTESKRLLKKSLTKPIEYEQVKLLGKGVLSIHDKIRWKYHRNVLKEAFQLKNVRKMVPIIQDGAKGIIRDIEADPTNIYPIICKHMFEILGHIALGEKTDFLSQHADKLRESFDIMMFQGRTSIGDSEDTYKYMCDFANEVFERANPPKHSLLELILKSDFSLEERRDQLFTFMFAGHETTANTIAWTLLELANNYEIQEKLYQELKTFQIDTYKDIFKYRYLTKVINESMRRRTVVTGGTVRILDESETIGNERFDKGTLVSFPNYATHLHPKIWKDPHTFDPERDWNDDGFTPFTRAPRDCLGRNMALLEIRLILINIIQKFRLIGDPEESFDEFSFATMIPKNGVNIQLIKRLTKSNL